MELSPKAVRFLIDAVKNQVQGYSIRLEDETLSDDDAADLINDQQYLLALQQELVAYHDQLLHHKPSLEPISK